LAGIFVELDQIDHRKQQCGGLGSSFVGDNFFKSDQASTSPSRVVTASGGLNQKSWKMHRPCTATSEQQEGQYWRQITGLRDANTWSITPKRPPTRWGRPC